MKTVLGKKFARVLEKHGWQLLRVQGSHHIYAKPGQAVRISVPIHGNEDLKRGLLKSFLKQTGLSEDDF